MNNLTEQIKKELQALSSYNLPIAINGINQIENINYYKSKNVNINEILKYGIQLCKSKNIRIKNEGYYDLFSL